MTDGTTPDSLALARRIADLVRERRATDVVLLDVRELVDYTDWFLICSGQSGRQNQAISEHVVKTLKADHKYAISKSGLETGSWVCLDLGDVVVHVFDPETRSRYDLELLWGDAPRVEIAALPAAVALPGAPVEPEAAPVEEPDAEEAAPKKGPAKRKRVVRKAAIEEADADNAPDSERPPEGEPEPEVTPTQAPAVRGKRAASAEALGIVRRAGGPKGRAAEPAPAKSVGKGKLSPTPAASRAKASSLPARSKPKPSPGPAPAPKPTKVSKAAPTPATKPAKPPASKPPQRPAAKPSKSPAPAPKSGKPAPKSTKPPKR